MARWLVMLVLTCGCRQLWGLGNTPELAIDASGSDDASDAVDATLCFGSFGDAPYCLDAAPQQAFTVTSSMPLDTQGPSCLPQFANACVLAASTIEIEQKLSVTGSRPLVLISTGELRVTASGMIDAASHRGGNRGPAANDTACDGGHPPGEEGGAQGGSFGGTGGPGGNGLDPGGTPGATAVPTSLRGGCPGTTGGSGGGSGGDGGGAIYLIAATQILISGPVDASGAGASGSAGNVRGGGGGGSGGMIVIETPLITIDTGRVFANGGGGGGGSSLLGAGSFGADPSDNGSAQGGQGGSGAGSGGGGSGLGIQNGGGGFSSGTDGGGGGGGGAGVVKAIGGVITNLFVVSPSPS